MEILQGNERWMKMNELLDKIKKLCTGFPILTKLTDHYTGASHRIFVKTTYGVATIFWFEDKNTYDCKSKKFKEDLDKC